MPVTTAHGLNKPPTYVPIPSKKDRIRNSNVPESTNATSNQVASNVSSRSNLMPIQTKLKEPRSSIIAGKAIIQ